MKMMKLAFVGAVVLCPLPAIAEPLSFATGEWKASIRGTMNGQEMSNDTLQDCMETGKNTISAADLEDMMGDSFNCSYTNVRRTSSTITSDVTCSTDTDDMVYNGSSVVNFTRTDFSLELTGALRASNGMKIPAGMSVSANQISSTCQ